MPNGLETTFIKCDNTTDWAAETTTRSLGTCGKRHASIHENRVKFTNIQRQSRIETKLMLDRHHVKKNILI